MPQIQRYIVQCRLFEKYKFKWNGKCKYKSLDKSSGEAPGKVTNMDCLYTYYFKGVSETYKLTHYNQIIFTISNRFAS